MHHFSGLREQKRWATQKPLIHSFIIIIIQHKVTQENVYKYSHDCCMVKLVYCDKRWLLSRWKYVFWLAFIRWSEIQWKSYNYSSGYGTLSVWEIVYAPLTNSPRCSRSCYSFCGCRHINGALAVDNRHKGHRIFQLGIYLGLTQKPLLHTDNGHLHCRWISLVTCGFSWRTKHTTIGNDLFRNDLLIGPRSLMNY